MLIKSLFYKYKDIKRKEVMIKKLKEEVSNLPNNPMVEKVQTNSIKSLVEDKALQLVFLENELNIMKKDFEETKEKVVENINNIDNNLYRDILFLRYIQFKKWEDIANMLGYSERHTRRIHKEALELVRKFF